MHRSIVRPLVRSLAVVLALLLGLILSAQPASAATGWTSPALIMSGHDLQQVAMGVDASGAIHVVGLDGRGIFYRTNRTGAWSTVRLADTPQHFAAAFDAAGNTWVAWGGGWGGHGLSMLTDAGGGPNDGWPTTPQTLAAGHVHAEAMAVHDGHVHIVFTGSADHLRYLSDASGSWVDTVVFGGDVGAASIAVGSDDRARIAFVGYDIHGELAVARETGSAAHPTFTFSPIPGTLDQPGHEDSDPLIALDAHERIHVAWTQHTGCIEGCGPLPSDGIHLSSLVNGQWTPLDKSHVSHDYTLASLAIDSLGRAVILTAGGGLPGGVRFIRETARGFARTRLYGSPTYAGPAALAQTPRGKADVAFAGKANGHAGLLLIRQK